MSDHLLTGHVRIAGYRRGSDNEVFVLLRFKKVREEKAFFLRIDDSTIDWSALNQLGAHLITKTAQSELMQRIQDSRPKNYKPIATRLGWFGDKFILPDEKAIEAHLTSHLGYHAKYSVSGDDTWKDISDIALGNSRLMLALSTAFVGPLGEILNCEQPSFQLVGPQSTLKTTILIAAGSVWGCSNSGNKRMGFAETWNATTNAFEQVAIDHNSTFLPLDELHLAGSSAIPTVRKLESGREKARLNAKGTLGSWFVPILSTSNQSVFDLWKVVVNKNEDDLDALRTRLIDVPPPVDAAAGMLEDLKGIESPVELAKHIQQLCGAHHGIVSRQFLQKLEDWRSRDMEDLKRWLEQRRKFYVSKVKKLTQVGHNHDRIHEKFGTVYAAGCLACEFKLLRWTRRDLHEALLKCEMAHIQLAEASMTRTSSNADVSVLIRFIKKNKSLFVEAPLGPGQAEPEGGDEIVYTAFNSGQREIWFSNTKFERVCGSASEAQLIKHKLYALGAIVAGKAKSGRFTPLRRLSDKDKNGMKGARRRFVVILPDVLHAS